MIIVVLHKEYDPEGFKISLNEHYYDFTQFSAMPRFFKVDCDSVENFSLKDLPCIKKMSNNTAKYKPDYIEVTQDFYHGRYTLTGYNWALPRLTRRKNPFRQTGFDFGDLENVKYRSTRTGAGVDIYILGMGYEPTHAEFLGRNYTRIDSAGSGADSSSYHEIAVASAAAGNKYGIAKGSDIFFVKFEGVLYVDEAGLIGGFNEALAHYNSRSATNRPAVLNCSWSAIDLGYTLLPEAVSDVIDAGISCFFPASNSMEDLDSVENQPAEDDPDAVIVGATQIYDTPMYAENYLLSGGIGFGTGYGTPVSLFAAGQYVLLAQEGNTTYPHTGTSFATPFVAGIAACMLEGYQRPTTRAQVQSIKQKLISNATENILDFPESMNAVLRGNNRLAYLDPHVSFETIVGLNPL